MGSSSWGCSAVRSDRRMRMRMRMRARTRTRSLLLAGWVLGIVGCAALDGTPGYEDRGADVPITTVPPPEDWRPPSPFIAGTSLIALQQPLRCHRYSMDPTQVAFTWTPSGQRRVYIAIFAEEPVRLEGVVQSAPIWTWMSGDSRSDVGRLHWNDGVLPDIRSLPDWNAGTPALTAGTYWFVIWAWDESRNVVASSEARRFMVSDLAIGQSPLAYCCEQVGQPLIKIACAPELPPEVSDCPSGDSGASEDWPCYCDFRAAAQICQ